MPITAAAAFRVPQMVPQPLMPWPPYWNILRGTVPQVPGLAGLRASTKGHHTDSEQAKP